MKVNISLEKFRKKEFFEEKFPGFILRVRKDDKPDLVYYNGIKAFEVSAVGEDYIDIIFPYNTYKCNTGNVVDDLINNNNLRDSLINICTKMKKFFNFSMKEITYKVVVNESDSVRKILRTIKGNENSSEMGEIETKIKNVILKNSLNDRFEKFIDNIKTIYPDVSVEHNKEENVFVFDGIDNDLEKIINIQYLFILNLQLIGTKVSQKLIKSINFAFEVKDKDENIYRIDDIVSSDEDSFLSTIKDAIGSYKGKDILEKKYQHQFMLNGASSNIFLDNVNDSVVIEHFEQEYEIINHDRIDENDNSKKKGRIDCIFYGYDKIKNKLTDIFLVELKVNETVVLGNNGVLTHLDDIKSFVTYDEKKNLKRIEELIEDRIGLISANKDFKFSCHGDYNVHFYTVIGFTDDIDVDFEGNKVLDDLIGLCNKDVIKLWSTSGEERKENKLKISKSLDTYFYDKDITLKDYVDFLKEDCTIKFYFEKNPWNGEKIKNEFYCINDKLGLPSE